MDTIKISCSSLVKLFEMGDYTKIRQRLFCSLYMDAITVHELPAAWLKLQKNKITLEEFEKVKKDYLAKQLTGKLRGSDMESELLVLCDDNFMGIDKKTFITTVERLVSRFFHL